MAGNLETQACFNYYYKIRNNREYNIKYKS